jgi:hypothetical protein
MKLQVAHIIAVIVITFVSSSLLISQDFMYWEDNFESITLPNLTARDAESEGEGEATLFTSGNAEISADNTTTAQLSSGTDTLVTQYKLRFDGDGITETGGSTVPFTTYDLFLSTPASITYVPDDNDVTVKLIVLAKNYEEQVANAGTYTATQTLTVHWVGP